MREHALIYLGENDKHRNEIIALLKAFDFDYTFLNDSDLNQCVDSLFNKLEESAVCNQRFPFNFIFFKDIDHDKILHFYHQCDENGFPFSHKAVMTKHNQSWIMNDLLKEIAEEHEFFQIWGLLNTLLKEANDCDPALYTEDSYEAYKTAFINAYIFRKQPNPDKDLMKKLIDEMINTKKSLILK